MRTLTRSAIAAALLSAAACSEWFTTPQSSQILANAFGTTTAGFSFLNSSYDAAPADSGAWFPPPGADRRGHGPMGPGGGRPDDHHLIGGGLMGGGIFGPLFGNPGDRHRGFDDGVLPSSCTLVAATGRVTCATETRGGLTIDRSASYQTASGTVQSAVDSTTDKINTRISVSGTVTRRDSAVSTIKNASDRTVTGLAKGSTRITVNGTSSGSESTTGSSPSGSFTASRTMADTTAGVVIPIDSAGRPTYPTAGTVVRVMNASVSIGGGEAATSSRREVITYDGTSTAKIAITLDGVTKHCTLALPRGRPVCS